ncbi:MAG: disulfide reductase [Candidatus Cloacimonadota bacterium]|nr:MAG: disulfide reductase [Candidatus Cloacimonadota bacterium]
MLIGKIDVKEIRGKETKKVATLSLENQYACYQCGKCSAGCPSAPFMDLLPNQVLRLLQLGKTARILETNTAFACCSCFVCSSRCPKGIDVAAVMESLRQLSLRAKLDDFDIKDIEPEELEKIPPILLVGTFRKLSS